MRVLIRLTAPGGFIGLEFCLAVHLYPRLNLKLNRAAALAEWRQLLSAYIQAAPEIRCEFSFVRKLQMLSWGFIVLKV